MLNLLELRNLIHSTCLSSSWHTWCILYHLCCRAFFLPYQIESYFCIMFASAIFGRLIVRMYLYILLSSAALKAIFAFLVLSVRRLSYAWCAEIQCFFSLLTYSCVVACISSIARFSLVLELLLIISNRNWSQSGEVRLRLDVMHFLTVFLMLKLHQKVPPKR